LAPPAKTSSPKMRRLTASNFFKEAFIKVSVSKGETRP
jgi:hypothetical protein